MADPVTPTFPNVMINGLEYQPFGTWDITYNDVRTIHETEGGTQEDVVIHKGRRSIAVSTTCLQPIAKTLVALEDLDNFDVVFYDIKTDANVNSLMRVSPNTMVCSKKAGQRNYASSKAVYVVSFTLEEYE